METDVLVTHTPPVSLFSFSGQTTTSAFPPPVFYKMKARAS